MFNLEKHPAITQAHEAYLSRKRASQHERLRLAACGIYNAGKSSLLNVLANRLQPGEEVFETGAARVTSTVSELHLSDVTLIDMPGIDGKDDDDDVAWKGLLVSDCYLYVHRLRTMEFEQSELAFLAQLKESIRGLEDRLVLVISQIDEVADREQARQHETSIRAAFAEAIGFTPQWVFPVSVKRYIKGVTEAKPALEQASGIVQLLGWLDDMAAMSLKDLERWRADSLRTEKEALALLIQEVVEVLEEKIEAEERMRMKPLQAFEQATQTLLQGIKSSLKRVSAES